MSKSAISLLRFDPVGTIQTGPPIGVAATLSAMVGEPLTLPAWVTDKPANPRRGLF